MDSAFGFGGAMFSIIPVIVVVMFVVVFGMILISAVRGATQWKKNNESPILTVQAHIVAKRADVHHYASNANPDMVTTNTSTTYFVTFEVESGDRIEFHIKSTEYGMLAEGDRGRLTFQGTRYLGFERSRG